MSPRNGNSPQSDENLSTNEVGEPPPPPEENQVDGGEPPPPIVGDPSSPQEESWNSERAFHDARLELARKVFWLAAFVVFLIGVLAAGSLLVTLVPSITDAEPLRDAAEFLATSLLPAVIGIFGSVMGFYFGKAGQDSQSGSDSP